MFKENKKQRKHFSKQFKRKVLLEYAKGRKPADILSGFGVNLTKDKKYAPKLIHKWKNELYKNIGILSLNYANLDEDYSCCEINTMGNDDEADDILYELLTKNNKITKM